MIKVDRVDETQMDVREKNFSKEMVLRGSLYALDRSVIQPGKLIF